MKQKLFFPLLLLVFTLTALLAAQLFLPETKTSQETLSFQENSQNKNPQTSEKEADKSGQTEGFLVKKVIDGDTIELENGTRVRYIGIDTPETVDPRKTVQCFGKEASAKNKELVEGKKVRLVKDVSETDRYGRLLRYIYVGTTFVNEYLVKEGYARASAYPPDVAFQDKFRAAETFARENNKGLWGDCSGTVEGSQTSSQNYSVSLSPTDCKIKGNISSAGEKIYHVPSGRYYDKTVIDETKGERWFCSEVEAKNAGWRASKV